MDRPVVYLRFCYGKFKDRRVFPVKIFSGFVKMRKKGRERFKKRERERDEGEGGRVGKRILTCLYLQET